MSPVELSTDPRFTRRVRRLAAVSVVALGVMWLLAVGNADTDLPAAALLAVGWVTMPAVLTASIRSPRLRLLLVVPASAVTVGLLLVARSVDLPALARTGWWSITAGVMLGGLLGVWFWYRWMPVPRPLDDPFSAGRWVLIGIHVAAITIGAVLVVIAG